MTNEIKSWPYGLPTDFTTENVSSAVALTTSYERILLLTFQMAFIQSSLWLDTDQSIDQ